MCDGWKELTVTRKGKSIMSYFAIENAIKFLQEFDHFPEYQRKLDCLVKALYGAIDVRKSLKTYLEREIEDKERVIKECPHIGTVKDNTRLGMKIAYQNTLDELKELEKIEEKRLNK